MIDSAPVAAPAVATDPATVPDDYKRSREQAIADAIESGLEVCEPADNELFIDIDSTEQHERHVRAMAVLADRLPEAFVLRSTRSKSGEPGKWHVRVRMPFVMSAMERIAWQAALCSDPIRELLSCVDVRNGDERPTLFFEKPGWNDDELPF